MIGRLATRIRRRLSYATVVSSIAAFIVLCGGAAFAANQLAKNSVGKVQLKANAVTTKKIKKNAVTRAKIKNGAVDGTKVKDGSLGSASLNLAEMPFQRIVHRTKGAGPVALSESRTLLPLDTPAYTQAAGENDFYFGTLSVNFQPACEPPRSATAVLFVDAANPTGGELEIGNFVGVGFTYGEGVGSETRQIKLGPFEAGGARFEPDVATPHTLSLVVEAECKTGAGATASDALVDVIGVR